MFVCGFCMSIRMILMQADIFKSSSMCAAMSCCGLPNRLLMIPAAAS